VWGLSLERRKAPLPWMARAQPAPGAFVGEGFGEVGHVLVPNPGRQRVSIEAYLTIVFAALAVNRWIEARIGWAIRKFVKTARRYRTIEIQAGRQTITAADPYPTTCARPLKPSTATTDLRTRMAQLRSLANSSFRSGGLSREGRDGRRQLLLPPRTSRLNKSIPRRRRARPVSGR
jgi:hypothetical protein